MKQTLLVLLAIVLINNIPSNYAYYCDNSVYYHSNIIWCPPTLQWLCGK